MGRKESNKKKALQNDFTLEANTMNPDQISLILVHIV